MFHVNKYPSSLHRCFHLRIISSVCFTKYRYCSHSMNVQSSSSLVVGSFAVSHTWQPDGEDEKRRRQINIDVGSPPGMLKWMLILICQTYSVKCLPEVVREECIQQGVDTRWQVGEYVRGNLNAYQKRRLVIAIDRLQHQDDLNWQPAEGKSFGKRLEARIINNH